MKILFVTAIFYVRNFKFFLRVLIISIHQFSNESSSDSDFFNIGNEQNGKGFNINIPFNKVKFIINYFITYILSNFCYN